MSLVIYEPMTVATDYVLAAFTIVFAWRLRRVNVPWAIAFFFTAEGALVGGTFHAIAPRLSRSAEDTVWLATVILIGAASAFLLGGLGRTFASIAAVKFVAYAIWVASNPAFFVVIVDYGISMLIVAVFHAVRWRPASRWVLGGIGTSILAAVIQATRLAPHPNFNHNDLYHVVQIVAMWMLYRGGRLRGDEESGRRPAAAEVTSSSAR